VNSLYSERENTNKYRNTYAHPHIQGTPLDSSRVYATLTLLS